MTQTIHPTAYIADNVTLGENITIGPFAVLEDNVELADDCQIGSHAVVQSYVKMGQGNIVHPHVVLGGLPQDTSFKAETVSWLEIGNENVFREGFTAHRSATENAVTRIGSGCFFMNNSHVAHDCRVGDACIFANNVAIGGHVEVGDKVFMGGNAVVHQFCRIGSYAIVRGTTGVSKDVIPFMLVGGWPVRHYKLNSVALRRAGITGARYKVLSAAIKLLKKQESLDSLQETEELKLLQAWLSVKSKRGLHGFKEIN